MMTATDENAVCALGERINHQVRMDHSRTHDSDDADAGWVLAPGDAGQVRSGVGAPVATQSDDQGLKAVFHLNSQSGMDLGFNLIEGKSTNEYALLRACSLTGVDPDFETTS